ncbi:MAG: amylo-alpha-1,6-glucosidase, partial [Phycisphaerales bacterium]
AHDFVVIRKAREPGTDEPGARGASVIAGYPWFTDWGRDAMIALPGLLLATGRHGEALATLQTFAQHRRRGLIPNHFDDQTGEPGYNSADASLWFLHAACEYLRASGDREGFVGLLLPACLEVIDAYAEGTDFGIRVDPADGLVMAGDETTQLTWMDAKRDGVVFTPRHGKPVELSALWHHGLLAVAGAIGRAAPKAGPRLRALAENCAAGFGRAFWNEERQCLFDVLHPPEGVGGRWRPNGQVRPNQLFAVSLAHPPLPEKQQRAVVQCIRTRLLTPHGVRTLDPTDPAYIGRFEGPIARRDAAYHNGTAWPWLMGPLAEAVLRIGRFSGAARADARSLLAPLVARLDAECPGQLAEVFDGDHRPDAPQRPGGCPAQAWSIAEVLRVLLLSHSG